MRVEQQSVPRLHFTQLPVVALHGLLGRDQAGLQLGNGLQDYRLLAAYYTSVYSIPDTPANRSPAVNLMVRHTFNRALTFSGNGWYRHINTFGINANLNTDSFDESVYQPSAKEQAILTAAGYSGFPTSGATAATLPDLTLDDLAFAADEPPPAKPVTIRMGWGIPAEEIHYVMLNDPSKAPNLGRYYTIQWNQFAGTALGVQGIAAGTLDAGGYSAVVEIGAGAGKGPTTRRDFACEKGGDEWADSRPDGARLRELAEASGGAFAWASDGVSGIPLPSPTTVSAERHVAPVAPPWVWTLSAAILLGAHWIARRRGGLAGSKGGSSR